MKRSSMRTRLGAAVLGLAAAVTTSVGLAGPAHAADTGVFIDSGGTGDATFSADAYVVGGAEHTNRTGSNGFITFARTVAHPIPQNEWNTDRFLESAYTVPGLAPGASYEVRLYFLDWYWSKVGQRVFDVSINGSAVLTDFDIIKAAVDAGGDGSYIGVEKDFTATAGTDGTVVIDFIRGSADQPMVNAIAVIPSTS